MQVCLIDRFLIVLVCWFVGSKVVMALVGSQFQIVPNIGRGYCNSKSEHKCSNER